VRTWRIRRDRAAFPHSTARPAANRRDQVIYCTYQADRARRTLRGIDEQVAKAANAVAG